MSFHLHRIVLYFSISGVLAGITKALNRVDYFVENNDTKAFCTASGFMDEYASWTGVLSGFAIGCTLFKEVLGRNSNSKCANRFWLLLIFVFPLSFNWIPFIHLTYGQSADWAWCTMRIILEDCSTFTLALVFNNMIWFVPALLVALAVIVLYIITVVIVIRRRREWDLTHDHLIRKQKKKLTKEVGSVLFLVLGFVFVNSLSLILRIVQVSFVLMTVDNDTCSTALHSFRSKNVIGEYALQPALEGSGTLPRALPSTGPGVVTTGNEDIILVRDEATVV
eukprot:Em0017g335a